MRGPRRQLGAPLPRRPLYLVPGGRPRRPRRRRIAAALGAAWTFARRKVLRATPAGKNAQSGRGPFREVAPH